MTQKSVFEFISYKGFMDYMLSAINRRGQMSRAAEFLKCQRSYLSRVISENLHLTPDHAYQLTKFWKQPQDESDFFLLLVEFERAANSEYRDYLKQKITKLKTQHDLVQNRSGRAEYSIDNIQISYFSSWIWSAVHFLTSITEYQTIESISARLGIKNEIIHEILVNLQKKNFVESHGSRWIYAGGDFHAPKDSPLGVFHHQNWRNRAILDAQDFNSNGTHYTAVQTVSKEDYVRIQNLLLQFISTSSSIAGPSNPEEGMVITCDIFKI